MHRKTIKSIIKYFLFAIQFVFLMVCFFVPLSQGIYNYLVTSLLLLYNIVFILKSKHNVILFFLGIGFLYFNYSICMAFYYTRLEVYHHLFSVLSQIVWNKAIVVLAMFFLIFTTFLKEGKKPFTIKRKENECLYFLCCFYVYVVSILSLFLKVSVIQKLAEYCLIIGAIGFLCTRKRRRTIFLSVGTVISILSNLILFGRAVALQLLILLAIFSIFKFIKKRHLLILSIVGILSMTFFGLIGDLEGNMITFDFFIEKVSERLFTSDTAVFAYYCSATFVDISDMYSVAFKLTHFSYSIVFDAFGGEGIALLFPGTPNYMFSLQELSSLYYTHWNGGITPFYFLFWLGPFGVVLVGALTAFIFNHSIVKQNKSFVWSIIGV